jgi:PhnB protein
LITPKNIPLDSSQNIPIAQLEQCSRYGRGEKVVHAVLNIGGSKLLLADEFPEMCDEHTSNVGKIGAPSSVGGNSVFLNLYFENVDEIFDKAQREGATVVMPLMDAFWGDRYGQLKDPFGRI